MTTPQAIYTMIQNYDHIVIHRHKNPDPDALGSQLGLRDILRSAFPSKTILATGYDEPGLAFMGQMDQVSDEIYEQALVIVCDTANRPRIDDDRWQKSQQLIKIDHHPNDDPYGDLLYVDTAASSASEIVTEIAISLDLPIPASAARSLYAGIVGDTGRFLYPATTAKTLELAAYLRKQDFDFSALSREMDGFDLKIAKLSSYVYDQLELDANGVARVTLTQEVLKHYQVSDADTSAIVSAPGKIRTVKAWAIFVEQADGHYRVRMRSKQVPINDIAKAHDGGGHPLASGANSYSLAENQVIYEALQAKLSQASQV